MRKLIIATAALAFLSSTALVPSIAFAQDKGAAPAASDTMSKGSMSKSKMSKKKSTKSKKSAKSSTDQMQKQ